MPLKKFHTSGLMTSLAFILAIASLHTYGQKRSRSENAATIIRQTAVSLLDSSIDDLKEVEDIWTRVELVEGIVKLLAKSRPERCRRMLDSLFDDALTLRKTSSQDANSRRRADPDLTIRKIIQIASSFDGKLAQSYIEKYTGDDETEKSEEKASSQSPQLTAALYLKLAAELIERDPLRATLVAEKALRSAVPYETRAFLEMLRKKDVRLANGLFISALQSIKARAGNDINELFLLYSYVFSPLQVLQAAPKGITFSLPEDHPRAEDYMIDPVLAVQYLQVAGHVLLNPKRYDPAMVERLSAGAGGDFLFINIIDPQITKYLPDLAYTLSMQRNLLAEYLSPRQRADLVGSVTRWNNLSSGEKLGSIDYLLRLAEETAYPELKDGFYFKAAEAAVSEKKYETAHKILEKISSEHRIQAKQFITYSIAVQDARDGELEKAEQSARRDPDLVRRAYILTVIASSLLKGENKDIRRAIEFLDDVAQIAQKLKSEQERVAVIAGVAAVYSRFDASRAFELVREVIKEANKLEDFTGDVGISRVLNLDAFDFYYPMYKDNEFSLTEAINRLARANFNEAQQDIRGLKSRLGRLRAVIALCNAVLSGKTS